MASKTSTFLEAANQSDSDFSKSVVFSVSSPLRASPLTRLSLISARSEITWAWRLTLGLELFFLLSRRPFKDAALADDSYQLVILLFKLGPDSLNVATLARPLANRAMLLAVFTVFSLQLLKNGFTPVLSMSTVDLKNNGLKIKKKQRERKKTKINQTIKCKHGN